MHPITERILDTYRQAVARGLVDAEAIDWSRGQLAGTRSLVAVCGEAALREAARTMQAMVANPRADSSTRCAASWALGGLWEEIDLARLLDSTLEALGRTLGDPGAALEVRLAARDTLDRIAFNASEGGDHDVVKKMAQALGPVLESMRDPEPPLREAAEHLARVCHIPAARSSKQRQAQRKAKPRS